MNGLESFWCKKQKCLEALTCTHEHMYLSVKKHDVHTNKLTCPARPFVSWWYSASPCLPLEGQWEWRSTPAARPDAARGTWASQHLCCLTGKGTGLVLECTTQPAYSMKLSLASRYQCTSWWHSGKCGYFATEYFCPLKIL